MNINSHGNSCISEVLVKKEENFMGNSTGKNPENSVISSEEKAKNIRKQLPRNDSKNIPRNFGKAIIIFI
jgi:hypothetical protein